MCDKHNSEKQIIGFTSANGGKRHLPPWMLPNVGTTATPLCKSDNVVENNCSLEKEALGKAPELTANAGNELKKNGGTDHKKETPTKKSGSDAKCEVKRRRKLSRRHVGSDNDITQKDKKKIAGSKHRVQKTSLKKSQIVEDPKRGSFDAHSVQGFTDDDMELTIEDMMAIAEEYVRDCKNKEQQEMSGDQCQSVKQFPATSESVSSLDSQSENKRSSTSAAEGLYSSAFENAGELVATGTSQTGDPAQDMLDLFLGPWLKKPPKEEKNKFIMEGMEYTNEFITRKSQEEFTGEEMVPLTKKKSSLRDKVAMFLD